MPYQLRYDGGKEDDHDALSPDASAELTMTLAAACEDPIGATRPHGVEDKYMRKIVTRHVTALLFIGHNEGTVNVLQIDPLD